MSDVDKTMETEEEPVLEDEPVLEEEYGEEEQMEVASSEEAVFPEEQEQVPSKPAKPTKNEGMSEPFADRQIDWSCRHTFLSYQLTAFTAHRYPGTNGSHLVRDQSQSQRKGRIHHGA